eukprot:CAMPEP_0168336662 /NCGR_PEP_ID=MMETSP0213-20121227/11691_1 /TAXON_ID=151035 /ORGANISM="Euplotes harpa, Strain FSP1.4" /LENGTH=65 /DNA_ID=CAMNT_0008341929 /DNA_START=491 /DNA_END=688 /DNA_ORIENTATION=+
MVKNIHDADELEDQSRGIRDNASKFMKGSKEVENEMKARNRRLNILIIIIVIAVLLYILVRVGRE